MTSVPPKGQEGASDMYSQMNMMQPNLLFGLPGLPSQINNMNDDRSLQNSQHQLYLSNLVALQQHQQ